MKLIMTKLYKFLFLLIGIGYLFFQTACEETEVVDLDFNYEFYPLDIGKYWIYDVDSIIYDLSNTAIVIDTNSYQVREEIVDTTRDNEQRLIYVIHHFERQAAGLPWQITEVYTTIRTDEMAERTEHNRRFIKLLFPAKIDQTWNGNRFFNTTENIEVAGETLEMFKGWEYKILSIDDNTSFNGLNFESVMLVQQADDENLIERRFSQERYAKNVGLISRELHILDTQCGGNLASCSDLTWEEKAEKGFILSMRLIEYN